jgi:WD40 repeat protein
VDLTSYEAGTDPAGKPKDQETIHARTEVRSSDFFFRVVGLTVRSLSRLSLPMYPEWGDPPWAMALSPDGHTLAAVSNDSPVRLWDLRDGREHPALPGSPGMGVCVAFSPDGTTLALGESNTIQLWDVTGRHLRGTLTGHTRTVLGLAFSPDGTLLASTSQDRSVRMWDVRDGRERATLFGHTASVPAVAFSPDGRTVASGG